MTKKILSIPLPIIFFLFFFNSLYLGATINLTDDIHQSVSPEWSNNSEELFFNYVGGADQEHPDVLKIRAVNIATKRTRDIVDNCVLFNVNPVTGDLLVRCLEEDDNVFLKIIRENGEVVKTLSIDPEAMYYAIWSPDGEKILAQMSLPMPHDILIYNINSDKKMKEFKIDNTLSIPYDWGCNNRVLYIGTKYMKTEFGSISTDKNLFYYDLNNGLYTQITYFKNHYSNKFDYKPGICMWSPDGKFILCEIDDGENQGKIAIINEKGNILQLFADDNKEVGYYSPAWSPDGKKIAFEIYQFDESKGDWHTSIGMIELDPSLQSGPRPEKIPEIKLVTFNVYLYGGIAIGILLLVITGFLFIRRKKNKSN